MKNLIEAATKDYREELWLFLNLCSEEDRNFIHIPKNKRTAEDYVRLMSIAIVLKLKSVLLKLIGLAGKRIKEICDYIKNIKDDFTTIEQWMEDFIRKIPDPELKEDISEYWKKRKETIDAENFSLGKLLLR